MVFKKSTESTQGVQNSSASPKRTTKSAPLTTVKKDSTSVLDNDVTDSPSIRIEECNSSASTELANQASPKASQSLSMSPLRRSSRASVPSRRFKDMEMNLSSRKRPIFNIIEDSKDSEMQPKSKKLKEHTAQTVEEVLEKSDMTIQPDEAAKSSTIPDTKETSEKSETTPYIESVTEMSLPEVSQVKTLEIERSPVKNQTSESIPTERNEATSEHVHKTVVIEANSMSSSSILDTDLKLVQKIDKSVISSSIETSSRIASEEQEENISESVYSPSCNTQETNLERISENVVEETVVEETVNEMLENTEQNNYELKAAIVMPKCEEVESAIGKNDILSMPKEFLVRSFPTSTSAQKHGFIVTPSTPASKSSYTIVGQGSPTLISSNIPNNASVKVAALEDTKITDCRKTIFHRNPTPSGPPQLSISVATTNSEGQMYSLLNNSLVSKTLQLNQSDTTPIDEKEKFHGSIKLPAKSTTQKTPVPKQQPVVISVSEHKDTKGKAISLLPPISNLPENKSLTDDLPAEKIEPIAKPENLLKDNTATAVAELVLKHLKLNNTPGKVIIKEVISSDKAPPKNDVKSITLRIVQKDSRGKIISDSQSSENAKPVMNMLDNSENSVEQKGSLFKAVKTELLEADSQLEYSSPNDDKKTHTDVVHSSNDEQKETEIDSKDERGDHLLHADQKFKTNDNDSLENSLAVPVSIISPEILNEAIEDMNSITTVVSQDLMSATGSELPTKKMRLMDNRVLFEFNVVGEEGKSTLAPLQKPRGRPPKSTQQVSYVDPEIEIKEEALDIDSETDEDLKKQNSGTQTSYMSKEMVENDKVQKLSTLVDEDGTKTHFYYVSVVQEKGVLGKSAAELRATRCMVDGGLFCCTECNYKTDKKANYYKHRRLHTGTKPHICPKCNYKAGTSSNLKRHMGIHRDIREFKCDICNLSFRQKIHLERHIKYKHEEKRIKCPLCDYVCANEQPDLKMHMKRKHSSETAGQLLSCPECDVQVSNKKDLKQHLKFHRDGPELKLFCKECSFVTDCMSRLRRHAAIHSNEKPFQCRICDYKATQKEHVMRHLRTQHKIEVRKEKRTWKRHRKPEMDDGSDGQLREKGDFTSGDKIFACNHCTMRFAKLINLYKHLHTQHSDIMPVETDGHYFCVVCEFSTTSKKNLLVHMRRHNITDQTPPTHVYSCVLCRYVNPRRRNLFQHMRKKHNIEIGPQMEQGIEEEHGAEIEEAEILKGDQKEPTAVTVAPGTATISDSSENLRVMGDDLAGVASMIKIEDLTRVQADGQTEFEGLDGQSLVIDTRNTDVSNNIQVIHSASTIQHDAADAIEGLQALAEQAGLIDNIIEEQVQSLSEGQTVVIQQPEGSAQTTLEDNVILTAAQAIEQVEESLDQQSIGLSGIELTEDQISGLQNGDMVEMDGEVYIVEITPDPENPDKQLLTFLPLDEAQVQQA